MRGGERASLLAAFDQERDVADRKVRLQFATRRGNQLI
jgi:hypothetical protein